MLIVVLTLLHGVKLFDLTYPLPQWHNTVHVLETPRLLNDLPWMDVKGEIVWMCNTTQLLYTPSWNSMIHYYYYLRYGYSTRLEAE